MVSDNWALDDHNRDIGRRLAKAGYVAIVPDVVSREGGTSSFPNREAVVQAIYKLSDDNVMKDLMAAQNYIKGQSFVQPNKIGVIGFCWGGGKTFLFATQSKDLAAAVIYYGPIPQNLDGVKNITAPVLGNYGELDKPISSQVPRLAEEMKKNGKSYDYKIYPDAPHAFNSDVREDRYRPEAAKDAGAELWTFSRNICKVSIGRTKMVTRREFLQKSVLVTGGLAAGKVIDRSAGAGDRTCGAGGFQRSWINLSEIKYASTDGTAIGGYFTPAQRGCCAAPPSGNS